MTKETKCPDCKVPYKKGICFHEWWCEFERKQFVGLSFEPNGTDTMRAVYERSGKIEYGPIVHSTEVHRTIWCAFAELYQHCRKVAENK